MQEEARGEDGSFEVALEGGETVSTRKLVLATSVFDELPDRPSFLVLWGGASTIALTATAGRSATCRLR